MNKTKYRVPVSFLVFSYLDLEAESEQQAVFLAHQAKLPDRETWDYIDMSFRVDEDGIEEI